MTRFQAFAFAEKILHNLMAHELTYVSPILLSIVAKLQQGTDHNFRCRTAAGKSDS